MANTLGEAGLLLYADTARLQSDMGKAAFLVQKHTEAMQTRTIAMGVAIGNVIGHVVSETVSKIAEVIPATIERMASLQKAAEKVGLPTQEFTKLNYAAGLVGVTTETLVGSLGKLEKAQAAALKPTSQQAKIFDALGVSVKNADGSLRDSHAVLLDFATAFKGIEGKPEAVAAGVKIFGRGFQEIIPLLDEGAKAIRINEDEAAALGVAFSESMGRQAEEAEKGIKRLHGATQGLWQQVSVDLAPAITKTTEQLVGLITQGDLAANMAQVLGSAFGAGVGLLDSYTKAVNVTSVAIEYLATVTKELGVIENNVMTLGFADGTISGSIKNIRNASAQGDAALASIHNPKPPPIQIIEGTGTIDGETLAGYKRRQASDAQAAATLKKLDGALGGGGHVAAAHKSHATSVDSVSAAYGRFIDTLGRYQGFLDGPLTKAEEQHKKNDRDLNDLAVKGKVKHEELAHAIDIEGKAYAKEVDEINSRYSTEVAALLGPVAQAQDQHRLALRQINQLVAEGQLGGEKLTAALHEEAKAYDAATLAAKRQADPLGTLLDDMRFEASLLSLTNAERTTAIALRGQDAESVKRYGAAILAQNKSMEEQQKNIQLMDTFRSDLADLGMTAINNFGDVGKSFKKMMDDIAQQIERRIIENWINKAFGPQGSTGQGTQGGGGLGGWLKALFSSGSASSNNPSGYTDNAAPGANDGSFNTGAGASSGGGWGSFFSSILSAWGGGHASGGPVSAGKFYEVGEGNKPEMLNMGGHSYLLPGNSGNVVPMRGGGRTTLNQTFVVQGAPDNRTREQMARVSGREARRAMARTGA